MYSVSAYSSFAVHVKGLVGGSGGLFVWFGVFFSALIKIGWTLCRDKL